MKRSLKIILGALLLLAGVVLFTRILFNKPVPKGLSADEQVQVILEGSECLVCHSKDAKMPFYSNFPVIGKMMEGHVRAGNRFLDLGKELADIDNISEAALSKLEHSVLYGNMPPQQYRMVHWTSGLNKEERRVLQAWISEKRGFDEPVWPIPEFVDYDKEKAALGETLFNDSSLSLDGSISCASCHVLEIGGADHADERVSEGIYGLKGGVNSPSVYNAEFNIRQFWNGRAADLQEQAAGPLTNPVEMGDQSLEQIVERLRSDKELVAKFNQLYPGEGLTGESLCNAIAEFERTLITPGSRFDNYLKGDESALSEVEKKGYEAFKKNACVDCHFGAALGGRSFEYVDVYGDYFADRDPSIEYNSDDEGLKGFSLKEEDLHKYKVPILRNVALTAPYFHDGSIQNLDEAVRAMAKYELGKKLSVSEIESIVAFLHSLTGVHLYLQREVEVVELAEEV